MEIIAMTWFLLLLGVVYATSLTANAVRASLQVVSFDQMRWIFEDAGLDTFNPVTVDQTPIFVCANATKVGGPPIPTDCQLVVKYFSEMSPNPLVNFYGPSCIKISMATCAGVACVLPEEEVYLDKHWIGSILEDPILTDCVNNSQVGWWSNHTALVGLFGFHIPVPGQPSSHHASPTAENLSPMLNTVSLKDIVEPRGSNGLAPGFQVISIDEMNKDLNASGVPLSIQPDENHTDDNNPGPRSYGCVISADQSQLTPDVNDCHAVIDKFAHVSTSGTGDFTVPYNSCVTFTQGLCTGAACNLLYGDLVENEAVVANLMTYPLLLECIVHAFTGSWQNGAVSLTLTLESPYEGPQTSPSSGAWTKRDSIDGAYLVNLSKEQSKQYIQAAGISDATTRRDSGDGQWQCYHPGDLLVDECILAIGLLHNASTLADLSITKGTTTCGLYQGCAACVAAEAQQDVTVNEDWLEDTLQHPLLELCVAGQDGTWAVWTDGVMNVGLVSSAIVPHG